MPVEVSEEEKCTSFTVTTIASRQVMPVIPFDRYSSFTKLKMVLGWVFRFVKNCRVCINKESDKEKIVLSYLSSLEIVSIETHLLSISRGENFGAEIKALRDGKVIHNSSCLLSLNPFIGPSKLLRVGG